MGKRGKGGKDGEIGKGRMGVPTGLASEASSGIAL